MVGCFYANLALQFGQNHDFGCSFMLGRKGEQFFVTYICNNLKQINIRYLMSLEYYIKDISNKIVHLSFSFR